MATTGPGTAHRHKTKTGYWYDLTDTQSSSPHTHTFEETAHPADTLTADEVTRLRALLSPSPEPAPPPPSVPGYEIRPGAGTIKAAIAAGHRDLVLRGGVYSDSFGSAQRNDVVTLTAYPGEEVIIDGSGQAQNFVYLGAGAVWTLNRIKGRNFRPVDSGVIGVQDGDLILNEVVWTGLGPVEMHIHTVYAYGRGSVTGSKCKLLNSPGSAVQGYGGSPRVTFTDSELGGLHRGVYAYDGTFNLTNTRITAPLTGWDIEVARAAVNLTGCTGTGVNGAVRTV